MLNIIIVILIVLVGSGLCSCTETALFSVPRIKVTQLAQSQKPAPLALQFICANINRPIATIVILNNIFNIIGSMIIGSLASDVFRDHWLGIFSAFLTFLIIVFAEIIPKTIGQRYSEPISLVVAIPVQFLTLVFTPIVWLMEQITAPFTKSQRLPTTNETEIRLLAMIGNKEGVIENNEAQMIQRVFQLNDLTAGELMTPRVILTFLPGNLTLSEAQQEIIKSEHSRILIIGESLDKIIGYGLKNELLAAIIEGKKDTKISSLIHPVKYVCENIKTDKLLKTFQENCEHLRVVLDESGRVTGVITLEDVLEILSKEIVEEKDRIIDLQEIAREKRQRLLNLRGFQAQVS